MTFFFPIILLYIFHSLGILFTLFSSSTIYTSFHYSLSLIFVLILNYYIWIDKLSWFFFWLQRIYIFLYCLDKRVNKCWPGTNNGKSLLDFVFSSNNLVYPLEASCICGSLSTHCIHYTECSIFGDKSPNSEEFKRYHLVCIFKLFDGFMWSCAH